MKPTVFVWDGYVYIEPVGPPCCWCGRPIGSQSGLAMRSTDAATWAHVACERAAS